jgi:hypothetical protein
VTLLPLSEHVPGVWLVRVTGLPEPPPSTLRILVLPVNTNETGAKMIALGERARHLGGGLVAVSETPTLHSARGLQGACELTGGGTDTDAGREPGHIGPRQRRELAEVGAVRPRRDPHDPAMVRAPALHTVARGHDAVLGIGEGSLQDKGESPAPSRGDRQCSASDARNVGRGAVLAAVTEVTPALGGSAMTAHAYAVSP